MVTLSSTMYENIDLYSGFQECIRLTMVLQDIGINVDKISVMEDNQGAQHLAQSKVMTQRSRHIDTKYHWLLEQVNSDGVHVQYCHTNEMVADHFTKLLGKNKLEYFRSELGVCRVEVLELTTNTSAYSTV